MATQDLELTLRHGKQRAVVSTLGASLRRFFTVDPQGKETDIVWGYSGAENKKGGQGDLLIPFPSRLKDGKYAFEGKSYQMPLNDKEGPNAIHGFLRAEYWESEQKSHEEAAFTYRIQPKKFEALGYPFSLDVRVTYRLEESGLVCEFAVKNVGSTAAPVGVGFHPYFVVGSALDEAEVKLPASKYLEFESLVPTGKILDAAGTAADFRQMKPIGDSRFNHCFVGMERDPDGMARAVLRNPVNGRSLTVWFDRSMDYLVVYSGDAIPAPDTRKAFAIEPMTCATDAFNHPEWGLVKLAPGDTFGGRWGVSV